MTWPCPCDDCGGTGVIHVEHDTWKMCYPCKESKMAANLVLDKCCKILNQELCCSSTNLASYSVSWDQDSRAWRFDLKIRGRSDESVSLGHREIVEYGESMVGEFAMMLRGVFR